MRKLNSVNAVNFFKIINIYNTSFTYFLITEFCVSDQRSLSAVFFTAASLSEFKNYCSHRNQPYISGTSRTSCNPTCRTQSFCCNTSLSCEISNSYSSDHEEYYIMGRNAVQSGRNLSMFRKDREGIRVSQADSDPENGSNSNFCQTILHDIPEDGTFQLPVPPSPLVWWLI